MSVVSLPIGIVTVNETGTRQSVLPGLVVDETAAIGSIWNADGVASVSFAIPVHTGQWNADGVAAASFGGASTYFSGTWHADGAASAAFAPGPARAIWNADGAAQAAFAGRVSTAPWHADGAASVLFAGRGAVARIFNADGAGSAQWHGIGSKFALWNADGVASAGWLVASPHAWNADGAGSAAWAGVERVNAVWNADGGGPVSWTGTTPGPFFFAWINPGETWGPQHLRTDEVIFSFNLQHEEGQCCTLEIEVKNPFAGFLAPGRKQWCYFSIRTQALFQGRLISVPGDITGEVVTLHFTAMPLDMLNQQRALADALMVRPYWDPVWIAEAQRLDPMSVLEGYSAIWHVDRVTLHVTTSDLLAGENGLIQFGDGTSNDVFYDSVKPSIEKAPLRSVYVDATVSWTQYAVGTIDMGTKQWDAWAGGGIIGSWPKAGTGIGSGWTVAHSLALDPSGEVHSFTTGFAFKAGETDLIASGAGGLPEFIPVRHNFGDMMSLQGSTTVSSLVNSPQIHTQLPPPGTIVTAQSFSLTIGDEQKGVAGSGSFSQSGTTFFDWSLLTMLVLRYEAKRERTENIRFMLTADMQPVFTDPGGQAANFAQDSEYLKLDGKVGLEGPYGPYKGDWQANTQYSLYDILTTRIGPDVHAWQVLRDHVSLASFDSLATAGEPVIGAWYDAGDNIFANGIYWTCLISGILEQLPSLTNPPAVISAFTQTPKWGQLGDPHAGKRLYQEIPQFAGNWEPGMILVAGDMVIAPNGTWYRVAIGHVATAPFYRFAANIAGQLLYELMLNPPPIGDISRRSYFPQARGLWSVENLIARARAHIIARARVLKVAFECRFEALLNLSLRNNVQLYDRRLPGGVVLGKVTSYSIKGNGDQGSIIGGVTVSCVAGNANAVVAATGTPEYADPAYAGNDWQFFDGAETVLGTGDIKYTKPADVGASIDDGLRFPIDKGQAVVGEAITTIGGGIAIG